MEHSKGVSQSSRTQTTTPKENRQTRFLEEQTPENGVALLPALTGAADAIAQLRAETVHRLSGSVGNGALCALMRRSETRTAQGPRLPDGLPATRRGFDADGVSTAESGGAEGLAALPPLTDGAAWNA